MKNPQGKAHRLIQVMSVICEQLNCSLKISWNLKKKLAEITGFNRKKMRVDCLRSYHTFKTHLFNTSTNFTVFPLDHCLLINIYIYIYIYIYMYIFIYIYIYIYIYIQFNIGPHFEYTR